MSKLMRSCVACASANSSFANRASRSRAFGDKPNDSNKRDVVSWKDQSGMRKVSLALSTARLLFTRHDSALTRSGIAECVLLCFGKRWISSQLLVSSLRGFANTRGSSALARASAIQTATQTPNALRGYSVNRHSHECRGLSKIFQGHTTPGRALRVGSVQILSAKETQQRTSPVAKMHSGHERRNHTREDTWVGSGREGQASHREGDSGDESIVALTTLTGGAGQGACRGTRLCSGVDALANGVSTPSHSFAVGAYQVAMLRSR